MTFNLKNMDEIDISQKIADFKQVFKNESRMILSAKFGDGKSYFLNKFINSFDPKNNDYYFITLHPVNYVVEDNKDIIEYIKRDILFQLIKDDRIFDYKEEYDRLTKEKKKLEGEVARVNGKLSNQGFVSKAPEKVINEERAKKEMYEEMLAKVTAQLESVSQKIK